MEVNLCGHRGGETFVAARDESRLNQQQLDIYHIVKDGAWHTLPELERRTGHPQASISARLRDFRKKRFGAFTVNREYIGNGLWKYQLVV